MNKVDDPGTQAVISALVFDHSGDQSRQPSGEAGDLDEENREDGIEAPSLAEGEIPAGAEVSEKAIGKRVQV